MIFFILYEFLGSILVFFYFENLCHSSNMIIKTTINDVILLNVQNISLESIQSAKTYPGANIATDHNLVMAILIIDIGKYRNKEFAETIPTGINETLSSRVKQTTEEDTNHQCRLIKEMLQEVISEKLTSQRKQIKTKWMTSQMLKQMKNRRSYKYIEVRVDIGKYTQKSAKISRQKKKIG